MDEKEKMLNGELYNPKDEVLSKERRKAQKLCKEFNKVDPYDKEAQNKILKKLFDTDKESSIMPNFFCDYGYNIKFGENFYVNHNCIILDVNAVNIGNNVLLGPNVQIYTANHPLDVESRNAGREYGKPVNIGDNVWIGGGSVIYPGVNIGNDSVIAAGSVVIKDVASNVLVGGNPAKIIKEI
ncbi:maltose O-acetyltransferase [Iocasia frigidifontis]|uniref:Acetyltransferase n=1 Tax=Iocasia fonsfrigidae TaxID=2682810 RepID=A0A8A7K4E6_9FIRM|nr:sugar O-acetyltransferase [Iocasia fonsfrigidae]QTL96593.1 maltose O-acetyltransferase [Iocasia fonsfrigidae]